MQKDYFKDVAQLAVDEIGSSPENLIPILQFMQQKIGYLPSESLEHLSRISSSNLSQIYGVATFYSQFKLHPSGKHSIKVCTGTACHVKGADFVTNGFKRFLNLGPNQDTDTAMEFTLEKVACLGCCTLAPVVQIDNVTYGNVNQSDIPDIVAGFKSLSNNDPSEKQVAYSKASKGEVRLGLGSCCVASGSELVKNEVELALINSDISLSVKSVGCVGMCHQVPLLEIIPIGKNPVTYAKVKPEQVAGIIHNHFKSDSYYKRLQSYVANKLEGWYSGSKTKSFDKHFLNPTEKGVQNFLNKQVPIVTAQKGIQAPLDLNEYKQNGGFSALAKVLAHKNPSKILSEIQKSGLRGRGGAGFPTWRKWQIVQQNTSALKYIICNGDEGDPGAFMDRMLLESFPFRIIEGMLIAAYTVGASHGIFYIRAEYPLAVKRIQEALEICTNAGYLGTNILNSGFNMMFKIFEGAGAFVCGEETALIASMEGNRGMPRVRPPFPAVSGFKNAPTLVNNVETLANIPWIIANGADAYSAIGTLQSKGTKVFALAGKINRGGLIEVPMGITINEIVNEIGGGVPQGKHVKAVQIGGPSGGCLPAELFDTKVDYENLKQAGMMMGSGGLVVMDNTDCIVDIARYFLSFTQNQSCGKCVFCRTGTTQMLTLLEKFSHGTAALTDIESLETLAISVQSGSLCGLGKTAPNPVLSTLKYFRHEYLEHINGKCTAGKCTDLISYSINTNCIGCTLCAQNCPVEAIGFTPHAVHLINQNICIKCDICKQVCPVNAVDLL